MKTILEFFGFPKSHLTFFRSDSPVTVFFENGIGNRYFISESISKTVWRFTDHFLRIPILIRIYWTRVSEFFEIKNKKDNPRPTPGFVDFSLPQKLATWSSAWCLYIEIFYTDIVSASEVTVSDKKYENANNFSVYRPFPIVFIPMPWQFFC
jgi:hypothetical protein